MIKQKIAVLAKWSASVDDFVGCSTSDGTSASKLVAISGLSYCGRLLRGATSNDPCESVDPILAGNGTFES